jgi:hypothetical protein
MRRTLGAIVLLAVAISAARAAARCGDAPGDAAAVAQARAAIGASCPCAAAASHRDYVTCADGVLKAMPQLPRVCRSVVRHCVARSTCGKPGTFTCCRTSGGGHTTCRLVTSPGRCAGPGECVGTFSSCCDACTAGGCATTTTTTTTTTTSPCGNGIIDPGELCDGTNLGICGSVIGHCGSPGEPLACQCCVPAGQTSLRPPLGTLPCCDGSDCEPVGPHECACEPFCFPAGPCLATFTCCSGGRCTGTCPP